jgi:hypothetical protein
MEILFISYNDTNKILTDKKELSITLYPIFHNGSISFQKMIVQAIAYTIGLIHGSGYSIILRKRVVKNCY